VPRIEDVFDEIRSVEAWSRNAERADGVARSISPAQAEQMSLAARMWPDLRPGALLALGRGGYSADHPMAQKLAELSAALNLRDHPGGRPFGAPSVTAGMRNAQAEARREANRAVALVEADHPPVWATSNPEALAIYRDAEKAGLIEDGLLRDPFGNVEDPQTFAFKDVLTRLLDTGITVPVLRDSEHSAFGVFEVTPGGGDDDRPGEWNRITAQPGTPEYRELVGQPEPAGPGLLERARQATGTTPSTPAEVEVAGMTDVALTTPVRGAFMGLDAPVQELQGLVRNLYGATHGQSVDWWETQSDAGIALTTGFDDAGSGFFVDQESEVAQERRRREAERGQIGGHNVTLGRWVVDGLTPFDPDTRPAMILSGIVDAGVQFADPSAFGLSRGGRAIQGLRANRLFIAAGADEAAGVIRGLRTVVRPQNARHWLDSKAGQQALGHLATEVSPYTIWRNSNRKMPLSLARRLADEARTPDEVRAILEPELGTSIRSVRAVTPDDPGPIRVMPARGKIDAHNQDIVAFEVEATLRNAHATDDGIREAVDRVARAENPIQLNAAIRRAIDDDLDGLLVRSGVEDPGVRSQVTRLHADAHEETSATFREAVTFQGTTDSPLMVGEADAFYPGAHLLVEHAPRYLQMPEPRAIRSLTSEFPHIFGRNVFVHADGTTRLPTAVLDGFQNRVWKPMQLMRLAWTARVIGEEQVRMAAAGYDSMFNHPLSFIAWRTGRRGAKDVKGGLIDEANEFKNSLAQAHGGWIDRARVPTGGKTTYVKGSVHERDRFNEAWGSELARLSSDPIAREVARAGSLDEVYEWFTRGGGNGFRADLAVAHPGRFDTDDAARAYIDTVQRRIDYATGGNADLLDAVRTGKFDGEDMLTGTTLNRRVPRRLDDYYDEVAPERIVGDEMRTQRRPSAIGERWDSGVDRMFGFLMTRRTNNLSRSPVFKQEYWRETERLIQFTDDTTKAAILAQAREAGIGSRAIRRMERTRASGEAQLNEVDHWAKGHALDTTKDLLYDLTTRGRFMDAARVVFPFGEAWKEVFSRWFGPNGLVANNPATVRRFQQMIQGARGEDFGEVMGAPEGEGFFWRNEFGEEVFVIPGSQFLTDRALGVPIPMTGSVKGLSMFGTVVPGLGPAMQIPVGWLLANKPGPQFLKEALGVFESAKVPIVGETGRDLVTPYGSIGSSDQGDILDLRNYLPTWMRTAVDFVTAGDGNEGQYGTAIKSVAAYRYSTGQYGNSRGEQQRLFEDSASDARWLTFIRALGQGILPSSPSPDFLVVDKDDRTVRLRAMVTEYRELQEADYETADQKFLEAHGSNLLAAVQPQSAGVEYAIPTSREGAQWVLEHPGIEGDLPHTYGFFAPQGGEFDYSLYEEQLAKGDRAQLDPKTFIRLMSNTIADLHYRNALDEVGDQARTDEGRAFLADMKTWLFENYPTWGDSSRVADRPDTSVLIRELYAALDNKAAMSTEAGRGLREYLAGRDEVMAWAAEEGLTRSDGLLSGAEAAQPAHDYLLELGDYVVDQYPGFKTLFDIVFSRELEEAEDENG
jgi:hypothetical protein